MKTKFTKVHFILAGVIAAYFAGTITQNLLAVKTFAFRGVSTVAGGVLLTWIVFAAGDIITELLGKKVAIKCILLGAAVNLLFCGVCYIAVVIPGNNEYVADCYSTIFGSTWRISIASAIAYIGGGWINTQIMDSMHKHSGSKGYALRAIFSTIVGQLIDDYLFIFLAFAPFGISAIENPWSAILLMPLFSWIVETITGIVSTPLAKKVVDTVRALESKDGDR